ncbi:MAG: phosphotransferase [Nocardioides sp.]
MGDVIGRGRDAEILDHGPGLVLRHPLRPRSLSHEAGVMRWLTEHGYPSPRVVEETAEGLVMERVDGPTMLESLTARTTRGHLRDLAGLHAQLHRLPVPPGLPTPYGDGPTLLHGDLHPGNVILTDDGPVVIDWTNASAGPAGVDPATTWLLLGAAGLPEGRIVAAGALLGRRIAVAAFLGAVAEGGEDVAAREALPAVLAERRHDPNMTASELARMTRIVRRHRG